MRTITARRPGACPECGQPGDILGYGHARRSPSWAHLACADAYARTVAADDLDALTYEEPETVLTDLLADLRHHADDYGIDWAYVERNATAHYVAEVNA